MMIVKDLVSQFSKDITPAYTAADGEILTFRTVDCFGGGFFASTFSRKLQVIFGECCISKLEKVASGARRPWQPVLQT